VSGRARSHVLGVSASILILAVLFVVLVLALVIALVIGLIPLGRLFSRRLAGREYTIQVVGWWLWYSAVTAVLMTVLTLAVK
jgi:hypothetical protein